MRQNAPPPDSLAHVVEGMLDGRARLCRAGLCVILCLLVSCGSGSADTTQRQGEDRPESTVLQGSYLYGESGPSLGSPGPLQCPPPLSGYLRGFPLDARSFILWKDSLGGDDCYGVDGPYRGCSDGYEDLYEPGGTSGGEGCAGSSGIGLAYALPDASRRASARTLVGGECIERFDGEAVVLVDCRLPHIARTAWGRRLIPDDKSSRMKLERICAVNNATWPGFTVERLVTDGAYAACTVESPAA